MTSNLGAGAVSELRLTEVVAEMIAGWTAMGDVIERNESGTVTVTWRSGPPSETMTAREFTDLCVQTYNLRFEPTTTICGRCGGTGKARL